MATPKVHTIEEAVALVRPVDTIGVPLGPGQPSAFLHALGERDDYEDVTIFGALLIDLFAFFTKPGVHYLSGFYGPAERFLLETGADVQFVPSDFRRFTPIAERLKPRVVATLVAPPDDDGWLSLSLHAGATYHEILRTA
ncbi:MAG: 4-hydroxybutyrate CoA-transferase, partial [Acidimicrobiales bacterium]